MFNRHVNRQPDAQAVVDVEGSVSFAELRRLALRLAAGLLRLGVAPGDVVAYQLPNSRLCCAIDLAVVAIGAIVLPFPPAQRAGASRPVPGGRARQRRARRPIAALDGEATALPVVDPDSVARILISSGTEAQPKLVAYSHNALLGGRGRAVERLRIPDHPLRVLFLIPLATSWGSWGTFITVAWLGGTIVARPRFDIDGSLGTIERDRPTHLFGTLTRGSSWRFLGVSG